MTDTYKAPTDPYQAPLAATDSTMVKCVGCFKEIHMLASVCPQCGISQRSKGYKNKAIAGLLAMVLGSFGVHRFYLGQWWGLFYLVLFWTGIPSIISFFEAFVFWFSDLTNWDKKHNEGKPAGPAEKAGAGTTFVIIAVVMLAMLFVVGILAAIAVPAYNDYKLRAQVIEALGQSSETKRSIQDFYNRNTVLPRENAELGLEEENTLLSGHTVNVTPSGMVLVLSSENPSLDGKSIIFKATVDEYGFEWDCRQGSLEQIFRPAICRSSPPPR